MDIQGDYLYMSFIEGLDDGDEEIEEEINDLRNMLEDKTENIDSQIQMLLEIIQKNHKKDLDEMLVMFVKANEMQEKRFKELIKRINSSSGNKITSLDKAKGKSDLSGLKANKIMSSHFLKKFDSVNSRGSQGSGSGSSVSNPLIAHLKQKQEAENRKKLEKLQESQKEDDLFSD